MALKNLTNLSLFHIITIIYLILSLSSSPCCPARVPRPMDSLFNETLDGVINLNYDTFYPTIFSHTNPNAFLVKFYASWCGHCTAFAPKYKKLARDALSWSPVIKLSAVNCADPLNLKLCRDQQVISYPTIKFFPPYNATYNAARPYSSNNKQPPNKEDNNDHSIEFILEETSTTSMRRSLVKTLMHFISTFPARVPRSWPQLMSLNVTNTTELMEVTDLRSKTSSNKPVLIVLESEEEENGVVDSTSGVGAEVILDLSRYQDFLTIYRIFYEGENFKRVFPSFRTSSRDDSFQSKLPILLKIKPNLPMMVHPIDAHVLWTSNEESGQSVARKAIVDLVAEKYLKGVYIDPAENLPAVVENIPSDEEDNDSDEDSLNDISGLPHGFTTKVHMVDLYNAIRYSLFHEVLLHQSFNQSQIICLQKYFAVVNKFFPFDNENPKRFVRRMTQWIHAHNRTTSPALHAAMRGGSDGFLFPIRPYVSCKGSRPELRGYPCALWLLFHTLTVSEYAHIKTQQTKDPNYNVTHLVLPAMKQYVRHFFTCKQCSYHFGMMAEGMESGLVYENSSLIWLWRGHNQVNVRVAGVIESEDPLFLKRVYPPIELCPECYLSNNLTSVRVDSQLSGTALNEPRILDFLISHYGRNGLVRKSSTSAAVRITSSSFNSVLIYFTMATATGLLINFSVNKPHSLLSS